MRRGPFRLQVNPTHECEHPEYPTATHKCSCGIGQDHTHPSWLVSLSDPRPAKN